MRDIRLYFKSQEMPVLLAYVVHHGFCPCGG